MNNIDYISYIATSTDQTTGYVTIVQASYYVPFFDFYLVYAVLSFTVLICGLVYIVFKRKK